MTSQFDPESFLDSTTTEAATKRPPLPAGSTWTAEITELKSRSWTGKKDPSQSGIAFDLTIKIDVSTNPDTVKALGGLTSVQIVDGIMADTTDAGGLDWAPGKNSKLRRYREALGMNTAGTPFSPRMMQGRMLKVKIKHDPYEGEIYDKIDSVAKA
jgi:hypothetical protein